MNEGKVKLTVWMYPETRAKVEQLYKEDNCRSMSEFIENAIDFYGGYLYTMKASSFLPLALSETLEGHFEVIMKRLGRLLFKYAVEADMCNHILAFDTDIDQKQLEHLRGRCVREVKATNGEISFKDALKYQKEI